MSKWLVFHKGICCHKLHALLHSYVFSSGTVGNGMFTQHCRSGVNILSSQRNYVTSQGEFLPDRGMLSEPVFFLEPVTINHLRGLFCSPLSPRPAACLIRLQVKSGIESVEISIGNFPRYSYKIRYRVTLIKCFPFISFFLSFFCCCYCGLLMKIRRQS